MSEDKVEEEEEEEERGRWGCRRRRLQDSM